MSNKKPEELSREKILCLALVMKDIQNELDNSLTTSNEIFIKPETIVMEYMYPLLDDPEADESDVDLKHLRKTKLEILEFLLNEGIIEAGGDYSPEAELGAKIVSYLFISTDTDLFPVEVNLDKFASYYKTVIEAAQPYVTESQNSNKTNISSVTNDKISEVSLRLKGKTLRLFINDTPSVVVKKFKTKNGVNITAYFELQRSRGKYLTKEDMKIHLKKSKSKVKDLPKTMGITGLLGEYFMDIDSKRQMLRIPERIIIPQDELEILLDYVKQIPQEK